MDWVRSADFVGRRTERRELADLLERIPAGDGGVVLLAGEPGIGKTRLAQEAADTASGTGVRVAWGRCRESEGAPPLWPWMQVFRQLRISPVAPETDADAASRFRLFQAVTERLAEAGQLAPLLIVLDDLHRADDLSLRVLGFVTDQIRPSRIGVIATYRASELPDGSAGAVIADLAARRGNRFIGVQGLGVEDVRQWVGQQELSASDAEIAHLHERSGGNPLFLTELVRLIKDGGPDQIPPSARALMSERVARLPGPTRDTLEMAAILGRDFGYAPLATALRIGPMSVVQSLEAAVRTSVLLRDPARPDGYRFSHVLIRDAVVDGIEPARRAELHAVALSALRDTAWAVPSELAHHAEQARMVIGDSAAAQFAIAAARAADRALAWEDAAKWWRAALELTPSREDRQRIRMRMGGSLRRCGRMRDARTAFEGVAAFAREVGDAVLLAGAALAVGETIAEVAIDPGLIELLDGALDGPGVPPDIRVQLMARRAMAGYWSPHGQGDARRRSAEAVRTGRLVGDDRVLAAALIARQFTLRGPDNLAERIAVGGQAREIADRLGDDDLRFRSHQWLIPDLFQAGDLVGVRTELTAAAGIAQSTRDPLRRWWVSIFNGLLAGFYGRDTEVEEHAREVGALGRRLGQPAADVYQVAQLVPLYWRAGRLAELEPDLIRVVAGFSGLSTLRCDLLLMLAETGRRQAARSGLRQLVANNFGGLRRDSLFLASLAILAATAVTLGDIPHARIILTALAPYATRNLIQGAPVAWGSAAWHLCRLAALIGDEPRSAQYRAMADRLHDEWQTGPWGPAAAGPTAARRADPLSSREHAVLGLLAGGLTNKDIAATLGISVHTVERHVANVFGKLGTHNRAETTAWAVRHDIGQSAT